MSAPMHTPWKAHTTAVTNSDGQQVAATTSAVNARLIAAAPEMLVDGEELIAAIEVARATGFQSPVDVQNVLDAAICFSAAIAKARGQ